MSPSSRGSTKGSTCDAAAARLLQFDAHGNDLREIGKNLYAWSFAHAVRVDPEDDVWVTDQGSDIVVKFSPEGEVLMMLGRKRQASDEETGPLKHPKPPLPTVDGLFRQVTDATWDRAGNVFISDGYFDARAAKVDRNGAVDRVVWRPRHYCTDADPGRIDKLTLDGQVLGVIGEAGR